MSSRLSSSIRSAAAMYDYQSSAENIRKMTFRSPATGKCVNRMWQLPTYFEELRNGVLRLRRGPRSLADFLADRPTTWRRRCLACTWGSIFFTSMARDMASALGLL